MVWYSHLLKDFPEFVVIYIIKGFGIVNRAEVDIFLELSCFFNDSMDVGNLISGSSVFFKSSLNPVHVLLKPACRILSITLLVCAMTAIMHIYAYAYAYICINVCAYTYMLSCSVVSDSLVTP